MPRTAPLRSGLAVALSVLLLLSFVTGSASAQLLQPQDELRCSQLEEAIWRFTLGIFNHEKCDPQELSEDIKQLRENQKNETKTDLGNLASEVYGGSTDVVTLVDTYANDSQPAAVAKAEAAAIEAMEKGKSLSETLEAVNKTIEDYYAHHQLVILDRWNENVLQVTYAACVAKNDINDQSFVRPDGGNYVYCYNKSELNTHTMGLVNGSSLATYQLRFHSNNPSSKESDWVRFPGSYPQSDDNWYWYGDTLNYEDKQTMDRVITESTTEMQSQTLISYDAYQDVWYRLQNANNRVKQNMAVYVKNLYEAYQNDSIDLSGAVSGYALAEEYATKWNESGYYAYAIGLAGARGLAVPDLGKTGTMTIQLANGTEVTGLLMSQEAPPNGTWVQGEQYAPSNIPGEEYFVTTGGQLLDLDNPFTILGIRGPDGQALQYALVQGDTRFPPKNVTDYEHRRQNLTNIRIEISNREPQPVGTGDGSDGSTPNPIESLIQWVMSTLGIGRGAAVVALLLSVVLTLAVVGTR